MVVREPNLHGGRTCRSHSVDPRQKGRLSTRQETSLKQPRVYIVAAIRNVLSAFNSFLQTLKIVLPINFFREKARGINYVRRFWGSHGSAAFVCCFPLFCFLSVVSLFSTLFRIMHRY